MSAARPTDLNNVRYFVEIADRGSLSAAARFFRVPPSLVSRRLARLEQEVGARLFQRTTRSLRLTDAGQAFLAHARPAMQSLSLAHEMVASSDTALRGRVRLSAPAGIADALWVTLSRFLREHPGIRVELELADRYVDLVEERIDMAIRSGPKVGADRLIGRRLTESPRWLFASPAYLERHGAPRTVLDLKRHSCVVLGSRGERVSWALHTGKKVERVIVDGRVAVNEARIAATCAADGFGIAFLPVAVCARDLAAGRLRRVLPRASGGNSSLWLVYPDRRLPAATRAVADHLLEHLLPTFGNAGV